MTTWVDNPALISGGVLFGQLSGNHIADPLIVDMQAAQSSLFANRLIYISAHDYSIGAPTDLTDAGQLLDGTGLGHMCVPNISALGELYFGTLDPGWPAGGCAAFSNGSMDAELQRLCDVFNTYLTKPFIFRLWREMDSTIAPWGAAGAAIGATNETSGSSGTYVTAWKYVYNFMKARCRNIRFAWCPVLKVGDTLSSFTDWYPGDAYVDWNMADVYINSPSHSPLTTSFAAWHAAFNSYNGTFSRKPMGIAETQVAQALSTRPADFASYTTVFGSGGPYARGVSTIFFWNGANSGSTYRIQDTPAGSLAAYQTMVSSPPFLGVPIDRAYALAVTSDKRLAIA